MINYHGDQKRCSFLPLCIECTIILLLDVYNALAKATLEFITLFFLLTAVYLLIYCTCQYIKKVCRSLENRISAGVSLSSERLG